MKTRFCKLEAVICHPIINAFEFLFSCRVGTPNWVVYSQTIMDIRCIIIKKKLNIFFFSNLSENLNNLLFKILI